MQSLPKTCGYADLRNIVALGTSGGGGVKMKNFFSGTPSGGCNRIKRARSLPERQSLLTLYRDSSKTQYRIQTHWHSFLELCPNFLSTNPQTVPEPFMEVIQSHLENRIQIPNCQRKITTPRQHVNHDHRRRCRKETPRESLQRGTCR